MPLQKRPTLATMRATPPVLTAPFSDENIAGLMAHQEDPARHPYTCEPCGEILNPETQGLRCPVCGGLQTWAHRTSEIAQ